MHRAKSWMNISSKVVEDSIPENNEIENTSVLNASMMSQKDQEEFSQKVICKISRFRRDSEIDGMKFDSPKAKMSWYKIMELSSKQKDK